MSTTIEPVASPTGMSAPIAAAIGSSIRYTREAPAPIADSRIARRSTCVEPHGTQMMMRGLGENSRESCTFLMKCFSICSVTVKSAITPSFIGRIAVMLPGVRPSICLGGEAYFLNDFFAVGAAFLADRDYRRFVEHDALAAHIDQGVGRAEIDRQVVVEVAAQKTEHNWFRRKEKML